MADEKKEDIVEETDSHGINLSEVKPGSVKKPDISQTSTEDEGGDHSNKDETKTKDKDETASESGDDTGKKKEEGDEGDVDYKKKFSESSSEALRLLDINKTLEKSKTEDGATITGLKSEKEALEKILKEKDPEGFEELKTRIASETAIRENIILKQDKKLDGFISATKGAEDHREALRQHMLANPDKTLDAIWKDHGFQSLAEASNTGDGEGDNSKKNKSGEGDSSGEDTSTEDGKGTSTSDPAQDTIGGVSTKEFNKLPLAKRKAILAKEGASM